MLLTLVLVGSAAAVAHQLGHVPMDRKKVQPAGSKITLLPTAAASPLIQFGGDRGFCVPTTFSWTGGTPTAAASAVQCGIFTKGKAAADGFNATVQVKTPSQRPANSCCSYRGAQARADNRAGANAAHAEASCTICFDLERVHPRSWRQRLWKSALSSGAMCQMVCSRRRCSTRPAPLLALPPTLSHANGTLRPTALAMPC